MDIIDAHGVTVGDRIELKIRDDRGQIWRVDLIHMPSRAAADALLRGHLLKDSGHWEWRIRPVGPGEMHYAASVVSRYEDASAAMESVMRYIRWHQHNTPPTVGDRRDEW